MRYYVYHICRPGMSLQEGYIGISKDPEKRFSNEHRSSHYPVGNCIRKHDDVVLRILLVSDKETCKEVEAKLRPEERIGWNLAVGGDMPPPQWGNTYTLGHRKETHSGTAIQADAIRGRTKETHSGVKSQSDKMRGRTKFTQHGIMEKALRQTDFTEHDFYHDEHGHVRTHVRKLCDDYNLESGNIFSILKGKGKTVKGWRLTQQ